MSIHSSYIAGRRIITYYFYTWQKDCNIWSVYIVCSRIQDNKFTGTISTSYIVNVLAEEFVSDISAASTVLNAEPNEELTSTISTIISLDNVAT